MKLIRTATVTLALGILGLALVPAASAASPKEDAITVQKSLKDKGFYSGPIDGRLGPQSRAGISQYQKSENLPVTGRLDAETAANWEWARNRLAAASRAPARRWDREARRLVTR